MSISHEPIQGELSIRPSPSSPSDLKPEQRDTKRVFPFFDLPAELRTVILHFALSPEFPEHRFAAERALDLDPANANHVAPLLKLFLVSRRMQEEASSVFFGRNTFQLFPMQGKFFNAKEVFLERIPAHYRTKITTLELRLGRGWGRPPKSWHMLAENEGMDLRFSKPNPLANALKDCRSLRQLNIFIECDPSDAVFFKGFRVGEIRYTEFCEGVIAEIFDLVPTLQVVKFDAYPSVKLNGKLMQMLLQAAEEGNKRVEWGPQRGWNRTVERQRESTAADAQMHHERFEAWNAYNAAPRDVEASASS